MEQLFKQRKDRILQFHQQRKQAQQPSPDWVCPKCETQYSLTVITNNLMVCPACNHHAVINAQERISYLCDPRSFIETNRKLMYIKGHNFPGYETKLLNLQHTHQLNEAIITGIGKIDGISCAIGVMDNRFLMGSMGQAVGEKITRLVETATKRKLPLLIFATSGGARMQEGIMSLMQMAKTSQAIAQHDKAGLLFISYLTHPTTGGVSASFAMLGDIHLAEPQCLIGFAGKRVIAATVNETLPDNFQSAEFLLECGFIDQIVPRSQMRYTISQLLKMHKGGRYDNSRT